MESVHKTKISELLVKVEAFKDLQEPVIFTSGELGIYYINTEKLLEDQGLWENFGDSPEDMIQHCIKQLEVSTAFKEVIQILAENAKNYFSKISADNVQQMISGGQRRDWIFSGPVAKVLGLPHLSLFKDGDAVINTPNDRLTPLSRNSDQLQDMHCLHIVDLLTKGSSAYDPEQNPATGWIVEIRTRGGKIDSLYSVVSRRQGGEEILASQDVNVTACVNIDHDFLREYSKFPDRACLYLKDPYLWSVNYLHEHGVMGFLDYFDPTSSKFTRSQKFIKKYGKILKDVKDFELLRAEVMNIYGYDLGLS